MNMQSHWAMLAANRINESQLEHQMYNLTLQRMLAEILVRSAGECIALFGPSRIGKSMLVQALEAMMNPIDPFELMAFRPVVRFTCRNNGESGTFTSKAFYSEALSAIHHPIFSVEGTNLEENIATLRKHDRDSNRTLAGALENALKVLQTRYLVIDEAQHLNYMTGGVNGSAKMMDSFKTLAEKLNLVLILVGAYPIVHVLKLSPHLLGRTSTVEMRRYSDEFEDDLRDFQQILNWYSEDVRFKKGVKGFGDWNKELYEGSFGVIGLLSDWIRGALAEVIARGDEHLTLKHMRYALKAQKFRDEIWAEIDEGESFMSSDGKLDVSKLLSTKHTKGTKSKKRKTRPFQSAVKRRKLGERA